MSFVDHTTIGFLYDLKQCYCVLNEVIRSSPMFVSLADIYSTTVGL